MIAQKADKILLSNAIFTADQESLIEGGIAIIGNKILAVGKREEVLAYEGENTQVEDFGSKMIMPGFCDSHVHFLMGCLFASEAELSSSTSEEEAASMLYNFYQNKKDKKPGEWVLGFNWYNQWWDEKTQPTKFSLDKYFPDQPVYLQNADAHAAWVNSKALELAGVDKSTPDPPYGKVYRLPNGEPSGFLEEMAMGLCLKYAYDLPPEKEEALALEAMPMYNSFGITSINDMQYVYGKNMGNLGVLKKLENEGRLPLRINFANGLLNDLDYSRSLKQEYKEGRLYYNGVKEFMDGIINTHTSIMLDKYTDDPNAPIDYSLMNLEQAEKNIQILHKEGINIQLHATGDGAVRKALDFYEKAVLANGFTKSRLSIEHMDLTNPQDWPRMGKYGVIASVQPFHICLTDTFAENEYPGAVGEEREKYLWAFSSLKENGAALAFGTDYPVAMLNPMIGIYRAVTRLFPDGKPEGGWNPTQRLSLAQALIAYTAGGAYKAGKEEIVGKLIPGMLADITVLDRNLFAESPENYLQCEAIMTMIDGEIVYRK